MEEGKSYIFVDSQDDIFHVKSEAKTENEVKMKGTPINVQ